MARVTNEALGRYDCLLIAPHADDAVLSCTGRILEEQAQSCRMLQVTLFNGVEGPSATDALGRLGIDELLVGWAEASRRQSLYAAVAGRHFDRHSSDHGLTHELARVLGDLGHRTKARDVYLPLGVGGHIDHRLTHEAGTRCFPTGPSQNVFFYEDRPYSLVPGSVRLRLGELAVRLPPAVTAIGDRAGLLRYLVGWLWAGHMHPHFVGWGDRLRSAILAARAWRHARGWQPRKAYGSRLQPVLYPLQAGRDGSMLGAWRAFARPPLATSPAALAAQIRHYSRRLGQPGPVERYWLLLPELSGGPVAATHSVGEPAREA